MTKFIDIISPIYQDLLAKCSRRKIAINLDVQDLTMRIEDAEKVRKFFEKETRRAFQMCEAGDKITIAQSSTRLSVKNSAKTTLNAETVEKLRADGFEVRARYGYDTIVALNL